MVNHSQKTKKELLAEIDRLERRAENLDANDINLANKFWKGIYDKANQGILIHRYHKPLYANSMLAEMYGYGSLEEIMALKSTKILLHPKLDLGRHELRLKGEDVISDFETVGICKDGTEIWEERRSFVIDWDGEPAVCSLRIDISDRKNSEKQTRESQERLSNAINSLQEGFAYFDEQDRLVNFNDQFVSRQLALEDLIVPGISFEDFIQARIKRTKISRAVGREEDFVKERMARHRNPKGPFISQHDDGTWVRVSETRTPDGGTAISTLDISDLKNVEERYAFAVAGSQSGLWEWNIQTGEQYLAPRWCEILGYEEGEMEHKHQFIQDLFHPDDKDRTLEAIRAHLKDRAPYDNELRLRRNDGTYVWVRSKAQAVWDKDGNPLRMAGSINDITNQKRTEQELRESEERHRAFATNVAHELRTPLSSLLLKLGESDKIKNINPLKDDVSSMSRLVEQLLSLARLDMLIIQEEDVVDLSQVSIKVATKLGHIVIEGGQSLEVLGADNPVLVRGNADALEQAVRNLVENAIKYSPRGGLITTEVDEMGIIKVIDRGQ